MTHRDHPSTADEGPAERTALAVLTAAIDDRAALAQVLGDDTVKVVESIAVARLARLLGDEAHMTHKEHGRFGACKLVGVDGANPLERVAAALVEAFREPVVVAGTPLVLSVSVGVSRSSGMPVDALALAMSEAATACEHAQRVGGDTWASSSIAVGAAHDIVRQRRARAAGRPLSPSAGD